MSILENLFPENLYHSYVVEGNPTTLPIELLKFLEEKKYIEKNNPDIFIQNYDSFTIEDSILLKDWHSKKGLNYSKRVCVIGAKFINHDAERTLLKMIEEPATNTHFFIVVPNSKILLDTILSRVHVVEVDEKENSFNKKNAIDFLKNSPKERIDEIAKIIENHKEDEGSGGIRYDAIEFVNELEKIVYEKWKIDKNNNELQFALSEIAKSRDYLSLPGSSVKMILEHIALVL